MATLLAPGLSFTGPRFDGRAMDREGCLLCALGAGESTTARCTGEGLRGALPRCGWPCPVRQADDVDQIRVLISEVTVEERRGLKALAATAGTLAPVPGESVLPDRRC